MYIYKILSTRYTIPNAHYCLICTIFFIANSFILLAQGESIPNFDSLVLAQQRYPKQDVNNLRMMTRLTFGYHSRNQNSGIKIGEQAIALAQKLNNQTLLADAYFSQGTNFMANSRYEETMSLYEKALAIYKKENNKAGIGFCFIYIGEVFRRRGNLPKALEFYNTSFRFFKESNHLMGQAEVYNVIGLVHFFRANYPKALENFQQAISINEKIKDDGSLGQNLNNVGLVYRNISDYNRALDYFKKAYIYNTRAGNKLWVAMHLNNEAFIYYKLKNYTKALETYQKALVINEAIGNRSGIANNDNNIGLVYKDLHNWAKALDFFQKAKTLSTLTGDKLHYTNSSYNIANVILNATPDLLIQNQIKPSERYIESLRLLKKALLQIHEINSPELKVKCLEDMSRVYGQLGDYKNYFINYKKFIALRDSIEGENVKRQIIRREINFEYEKKEANLKFSQQIALQKLEQQKLQLLSALVFIVLLSAIYWMLQRQMRLKQDKENSLNFSKQLLESTEEERRRIASDLHDSISHELLALKTTLKQDMREVTGKIDTIINDVRSISRNLRPVMFEEIGLAFTLEQLIDRLQTQNKFMISTEIEYKGGLLNATQELQLYRIVQESLTNVMKYAKAHAAKVVLREVSNTIQLEIRDNGQGFKVKETINSGKAFGLHNIIERARMIGGEAKIQSSPEGTVVLVEIKNLPNHHNKV